MPEEQKKEAYKKVRLWVRKVKNGTSDVDTATELIIDWVDLIYISGEIKGFKDAKAIVEEYMQWTTTLMQPSSHP